MCRTVFKKFKACINVEGINAHRNDHDAIAIVYRSLQQDRDRAEITGIIRRLHEVVDGAIEIRPDGITEETAPYDISKIDFDRLRQEFERSPAKRTTIQDLRQAIDKQLLRLLQQHPLRTDFQRHYEEIVAGYNREKDRVTIEKTFEALIRFIKQMGEEESRAVREGLDEEALAIFDLLKKPDLSPAEIQRIKSVAVGLLKTLKAEMRRIDLWRDKEATRDAVRLTIHDFLWSDKTGLPIDHYTEDDVQVRADDVYRHVYRAYPTFPSPFYEEGTAVL